MKSKNTLFKNTIYKSMLSFVNIVIPLIIGPYITRLLEPELYGIYNKNLSVFQMFLAFASFGIYNFGMREISKCKNDSKKVSRLFTNLFVFSLVSNILVLIVYLIYAFSNSSGISLSIYLIFILQFVGNIFYIEFVNEALENYKFITTKSILVKILYFILLILFVRKPDQILIYSLIVSFTVFLDHIISFVYAKSKISFDFSHIEIKKYLKPLLIVFVISNVDLLYSQLDKVMLGKYNSNISVTVYYIAYFIVSTLAAIPYSIINVSIPRLSYILKNESKEKYEEKLNNSISSLLFVIVPICLGVFVVAKEIIIIYSGEKYLNAIIPLMVASVIRIIISMESVMNNLVLFPNDQENQILKISFTGGILNLIMNYILVLFKILTPTTALITTGISELVIFIIYYYYGRVKLNINIKIFTKSNVLYLILGILFIPISFIIRKLNLGFMLTLILIILICSLMYFIVLYIKKDNNLCFILSKIKVKLKVG